MGQGLPQCVVISPRFHCRCAAFQAHQACHWATNWCQTDHAPMSDKLSPEARTAHRGSAHADSEVDVSREVGLEDSIARCASGPASGRIQITGTEAPATGWACPSPSRRISHGAPQTPNELGTPNASITKAPPQASGASAATIKAAYSKPHGSAAHAMPPTMGQPTCHTPRQGLLHEPLHPTMRARNRS